MEISILRGIHLMSFLTLVGTILPAHADDSLKQPSKLNGGYFLLHSLTADESQVSMLMLVKHAPAEIIKYADDVTRVAKKNLEALDRFQDGDATIRFDQSPLPPIEQNVRDSIKGDKQHQLLFGTSDSEFVRCFLVSQIEASTYALHLSKVLGEQETDPARAKTLQHFSNEWGVTRAQAYRLLRNY